jgi:hypothetical protein
MLNLDILREQCIAHRGAGGSVKHGALGAQRFMGKYNDLGHDYPLRLISALGHSGHFVQLFPG